MNKIPVVGLYFLININASNTYMAGKILDVRTSNNENCFVNVLKTDMTYYKDGDFVTIFIYNNHAITVEYFEHEYELLARII